MITQLATVLNAGEGMTSKIDKAANNMYSIVKTVAIAVAVPCAAVAFLVWGFWPDQKVAASGKSWVGRILLALFAILIVTEIIQFVQGLV